MREMLVNAKNTTYLFTARPANGFLVHSPECDAPTFNKFGCSQSGLFSLPDTIDLPKHHRVLRYCFTKDTARLVRDVFSHGYTPGAPLQRPFAEWAEEAVQRSKSR